MFFLTTPVHQWLLLVDWQIDNTLDCHACVKYMTYFGNSTKRKMWWFGTFLIFDPAALIAPSRW